MHILFLLLLLVGSAPARIIRVPEDQPTVQLGMNSAFQYDTVLVARGVWYENLISPQHSILLASNFLFSADSTDILETILDGSHQTTVIQVRNTGSAVFHVQGFTIRNGMSPFDEYDLPLGGAVHIFEETRVALFDILFHGSESPDRGSSTISNTTFPFLEPAVTITMERVHFLANPVADAINGAQVDLGGLHKAIMRDIVLDGQDSLNQGIELSADTLVVEGFVVKNLCQTRVSSVSDSTSIHDVRISSCKSLSIAFQNFDNALHINDLAIEDCEWMDWSAGQVYLNGEPLLAENLYFERNRYNRALGDGSARFVRIVSGVHGQIENLVFRENVIGDSLPEGAGEDETYGRWVRPLSLHNVSVTGLQVLDNTAHDEQIYPASRIGVLGAFTTIGYSEPGSAVLENLIYSGNLLIDYYDYTELDPDGYNGSNGRSLWLGMGTNADSLTLRNARFENERFPNHAPETNTMGGDAIGSVLYAELESGDFFQAENITVRDCDDGGIKVVSYVDNLILNNIAVENVGRRGIMVEDWNAHWGTHLVSNCWISGIYEQDLYSPYPYEWCHQQPLSAFGSGNALRIENVTVANSMTTVGSFTEATWFNCLFWNNDFEYFLRPDGASDVARFHYCNLPEDLPGSNNLLGVDPNFQWETGAPYLDSGSPLIDAGDPDSRFNDVEDPENPTWALWPSQGGLRSDIGYTGGPRATIPDTSWVRVEPELPARLPESFLLGNPFPNPFNSATRIPFQVTQPSSIALSVHNLQGRLVSRQATRQFATGKHEFMLDGSKWASGIYLVAVEAVGAKEVKKVLLLK